MSKKSSSNFFTGTLFGLGLGLLLAYYNNDKDNAKQELKIKLDHLLELMKEIDIESVRQVMNSKITELFSCLESLDKETVLSLAKEKTQIVIEKADDLIDLSREVNINIVEKAASDIKKAAMDALASILLQIDEKEELLKKEAKLNRPKKAIKRKTVKQKRETKKKSKIVSKPITKKKNIPSKAKKANINDLPKKKKTDPEK